MPKYDANIYKFELLGNCEDGFDCNMQWSIASREFTDLSIDRAQSEMEYLAQNLVKTLPLNADPNEDETGVHNCEQGCFEIIWDDEMNASINCGKYGVAIGSISIIEEKPAQQNCVACGGELEPVTETCIPLNPAWSEKQNVCDGCFESMQKQDGFTVICNDAHGQYSNCSSITCESCDSKILGNRYIASWAIYQNLIDGKGQNYYGLHQQIVCDDCHDELCECTG